MTGRGVRGGVKAHVRLLGLLVTPAPSLLLAAAGSSFEVAGCSPLATTAAAVSLASIAAAFVLLIALASSTLRPA